MSIWTNSRYSALWNILKPLNKSLYAKTLPKRRIWPFATTKNKNTPSYTVVATKWSQFLLVQRDLDWPDQSCNNSSNKKQIHSASWFLERLTYLVLVTFVKRKCRSGMSKRFLMAYRSCQALKRDTNQTQWDFLKRSVQSHGRFSYWILTKRPVWGWGRHFPQKPPQRP